MHAPSRQPHDDDAPAFAPVPPTGGPAPAWSFLRLMNPDAWIDAVRPTRREQYLRRFFAYALPYKALLLATIAFGLLKFVINYAFPWVIGEATDLIAGQGRYDGWTAAESYAWLWRLAVLALGLSLMHGIVTYLRGHLAQVLGLRVIRDIRQDIFDHLHRLSLQFYSRERTGSIVSRVIGDISNASQIVNGGIINVALDVFTMIFGLILLLSIDWRLTVAAMATVPLYAWTFRYFNPRVKRASKVVQSSISRISGNVQERLAGIALVKTYTAEERESRLFRADTEVHYARNLVQSRLSQSIGALSETLVHVNQTIVVGYGGYLVISGDLTPGSVIKFLGYLAVMYLPVRRFAEINVIFQTSAASIERIFQVFDITPRVVDKPNAVGQSPTRGEVVFQDVKFSYLEDSDESRGLPETHKRTDLRGDDVHDRLRAARRERVEFGRQRQRRAGRDVYHARDAARRERGLTPRQPDLQPVGPRRWVLDGLSFGVEPGQRVALVGPSGSGKTTLVSLLPRLYDVSAGAIRVDGIDLRDYAKHHLRRGIGIVQQDSFLFSGTIRENLKYGRQQATDDELFDAAKAANAHEFISELPDGYDSAVGERGVTLSGGQRQRLSIARAILKDPRILILDEATSALDVESERLVQQALERLMHGRTCFIIAHRLSTIRNADRILVIHNGVLAEDGTHDQLLQAGGLYAKLARQAFGTASSHS